MMKAHGIPPSGSPTRSSSSAPVTPRREPTSKKRKLDSFAEDAGGSATDEEEGMLRVKDEPVDAIVRGVGIKEEADVSGGCDFESGKTSLRPRGSHAPTLGRR